MTKNTETRDYDQLYEYLRELRGLTRRGYHDEPKRG
jgi:hypothetical protein